MKAPKCSTDPFNLVFFLTGKTLQRTIRLKHKITSFRTYHKERDLLYWSIQSFVPFLIINMPDALLAVAELGNTYRGRESRINETTFSYYTFDCNKKLPI